MTHYITIGDYYLEVESDKEPYEVLWDFMCKNYPVRHTRVGLEDEEQKALIGRLGEHIILTEGETEARTTIGVIKVSDKPSKEKISFAKFRQWIVNEWEKLSEDGYNRTLAVLAGRAVGPKFRLFTGGFNDPDCWYKEFHKK